MAQLRIFFILLLGWRAAWGLNLEYVADATLTHKQVFRGTSIGGLSAIFYDSQSSILTAVCDDRGKLNEPRFYEFQFSLEKKQIQIRPQSVKFVRNKDNKPPMKTLDMEGMARLPWGNWLISTEGDNNLKPRLAPTLMDVKVDGTWVKNFSLPENFQPSLTGRQVRGIANNRGPEGLSVAPSGTLFLVAMERPLVNAIGDKKQFVDFVSYTMPEAWVLSPSKNYSYPVGAIGSQTKEIIESGISEILFIDENRILVLERGVSLTAGGLKYSASIYLADLRQVDADLRLKKVLVLNFQDVVSTFQHHKTIDNYEGMTWGPEIHGKKSLLLVSDDNFMRNQKTHFVLFQFNENP